MAPWAMPTAWAAIDRAGAVEGVHGDTKALALLADPVGRRNAHVLEDHLAGRAAVHAELGLELADPQAVLLLDDEARTRPGPRPLGSVLANTT